MHVNRHLFAEQGALMPGVRDVLDRLGADPGIVQTLVTGNVPQVAAAIASRGERRSTVWP